MPSLIRCAEALTCSRREKSEEARRHRIARHGSRRWSEFRSARERVASIVPRTLKLPLCMCGSGRQRGEQHGNLACQKIGHGRIAAAIGHMDHIDAGLRS